MIPHYVLFFDAPINIQAEHISQAKIKLLAVDGVAFWGADNPKARTFKVQVRCPSRHPIPMKK
jgi:hypothetical protein